MIRGGHQADKREEQTDKSSYKMQSLGKEAPKALPGDCIKGCCRGKNLYKCRAWLCDYTYITHTFSFTGLLG